MEELYFESLKMIKQLDIKTEKDYNILVHNHSILSIQSLKYMSQTKSFKTIIEIAKEVA